MIKTIPNWLLVAIDFLNRKFPEDEDVNLCLLYGYDEMVAANGDTSDGKYMPLRNTIYLVDYKNLGEHYGGANTSEDIAIFNLFHEYRHHQQYIFGLDFDEDDAEEFAMTMWREYLVFEDSLKHNFKILINNE